MPVFELQVNTKEVDRFLKNGRLIAVLNKHISRQMLGFGTFVKNEIKRTIRGGSIQGAELGVQQYLKGSEKLLFHTGRFANSVKFKYKREGAGLSGIEVGWFNTTTSNGFLHSRLIEIIEKGRTWKPTDAERMAVALKAKAAGAPIPNGARKELWHSPPRPFLADIQRDQRIQARFRKSGKEALDRTIAELTK